MNNSIYPCLLIKGRTAEAGGFYIDTFGDGIITQTSPYVVQIRLSGHTFMLLNEGPPSSPNASVSFTVLGETVEETERYWNRLKEGGNVMMPLDTYPWSEKYGWLQDKYGVSWQLITGTKNDIPQKFSPSLLFTGNKAGKAESAVQFYTQIFPDSNIDGILRYQAGEADRAGFVKHAQFSINDYIVTAMDSSADHGFGFNDAISLVVECDTQEEIDHYWNKLTGNGGQEVMCGWLTDPFGVSWQIVPKKLGELLRDPQRAQRVMGALMQMKRLIIKDLENA